MSPAHWNSCHWDFCCSPQFQANLFFQVLATACGSREMLVASASHWKACDKAMWRVWHWEDSVKSMSGEPLLNTKGTQSGVKGTEKAGWGQADKRLWMGRAVLSGAEEAATACGVRSLQWREGGRSAGGKKAKSSKFSPEDEAFISSHGLVLTGKI